jgi:DNA polymerase I-like protein with 3'-5' exonuclease and polymerase domains
LARVNDGTDAESNWTICGGLHVNQTQQRTAITQDAFLKELLQGHHYANNIRVFPDLSKLRVVIKLPTPVQVNLMLTSNHAVACQQKTLVGRLKPSFTALNQRCTQSNMR